MAALEAARATEESLARSIAAAWRQGSDSNGRNYYYNYITGESSWTIPEGWVPENQDDCWVRNTDDRGNVYYFNMITSESRWLPPCHVCGVESLRWCEDCQVAYCEKDFHEVHFDDNADPNFANHSWTGVESSKDKLERGEVHCCECKRRVAVRMCTTCWDSYCDRCFLYVHHVGALKKHESVSYKKAKFGWYCIKARSEEEKDYYVNGATGETTYEKPEELMTAVEREYYRSFLDHRKVAEDYVAKIEDLQYELEKIKYERDLSIANDIMAKGTSVIEQTKHDGTESEKDAAAQAKRKAIMRNDAEEYRKRLLTPEERRRGKKRSDYIQSLLAALEEGDEGQGVGASQKI